MQEPEYLALVTLPAKYFTMAIDFGVYKLIRCILIMIILSSY